MFKFEVFCKGFGGRKPHPKLMVFGTCFVVLEKKKPQKKILQKLKPLLMRFFLNNLTSEPPYYGIKLDRQSSPKYTILRVFTTCTKVKGTKHHQTWLVGRSSYEKHVVNI